MDLLTANSNRSARRCPTRTGHSCCVLWLICGSCVAVLPGSTFVVFCVCVCVFFCFVCVCVLACAAQLLCASKGYHSCGACQLRFQKGALPQVGRVKKCLSIINPGAQVSILSCLVLGASMRSLPGQDLMIKNWGLWGRSNSEFRG